MTPEGLEARRKTAVRNDAVDDAFDAVPLRPVYPLPNLDQRRLRLLAEWESLEALKLARAVGVPTP